jgi:hypothetical protein
VKHQKTARRAEPITRTVEPSTKKCGHPSRVNIDVDEHEVWHCVKDAGHQDDHYSENDDGSAGMAISLTATEKRYWVGFNAGVKAAAKLVSNHSCVSSCCDAQPSGGDRVHCGTAQGSGQVRRERTFLVQLLAPGCRRAHLLYGRRGSSKLPDRRVHAQSPPA